MAGAHGAPPHEGVRYTQEDLRRLMSPLGDHARVVLAVSGGSDSLALMHMAARWAANAPRPPALVVMTVDHGLRPSSDAEAAFVARQADLLGLDHEILSWSGPKPKSGLQEAARAARYTLLTEAARRRGASAIVTAHTADDQAETMLMRLARGSGLDGLAGIPAQTNWAGITILRPLLGERRGRLRAMLRASAMRWVNDPGNVDVRFERVRIRLVMRALAPLGIDAARLALSAERLSRAREALNAQTGHVLARQVRLSEVGAAQMPRAILQETPAEIGLRVLGAVISAVGGREGAPRLAKLEALLSELLAHGRPGERVKLTLGGVIVVSGNEQIEFYREYGRIGEAATLSISPGETRLWDGRFWISADRQAPAHALIRPLGEDGVARLGMAVRHDQPRPALLAMPGVYCAGTLIAAPPLMLQDAADHVASVSYSARFAHDFAAHRPR